MSRDCVLALDLGTTSVRALVVVDDGSIPARAARPLGLQFPRAGWVEQDPGEMWERSVEVMREALEAAGRPGLAGIGVVAQRSTCIAWEAVSGRVLAPAIGWQDQRNSERTAELRALGIPITTLASATKLEWWLRHDDAVKKAAAAGTLRLGTPDAWLGFQLTRGAAHVTDGGHASCTALFDPSAWAFADPLCALFSVPREALPELVPTSGVVGETAPDLLGASVPVAARAGDQQASAFAQGVFERGQAKLTLGTSAMLDVHTGDAPAEIQPGAYPLALWELADHSRAFCLEGTVITAGSSIEWGVELGLAPDAGALDALARSVGSSQGVVVVPAFQGLGTPWLDEGARGLVLGLTRGSGRAQLARALFEGVAQRCADLAEALAPGDAPLSVDGGLGRSELLVQSIADYAGRPVLRAREPEATALGAAFLAGLATGVWSSPAECRGVVGEPQRFAPSLGADARAELRRRFREALGRSRTPEA